MKLCLKHGLHTQRSCIDCKRERDQARGSRRERGIGPNHEALARELKEHPQFCYICGEAPTEDNPITVGHIVSRVHCLAIGKDPDDPSNLQPECQHCNLRKGS